jgi:hypothetical protein
MTTTETTATVLLVPGERFFIKEVALEGGADVVPQVELALEEASPFPLAQLYHGFVVSRDRRHALAFAAYRKRFTAEEQAEWPSAAAVLPDFAALIGAPPDKPLIVVHRQADGLSAVAWDGQAGVPRAVLARAIAEPTEAQVAEMVTELQRRANLPDAEVRRLEGEAGVGLDEEGNATIRLGGEETAHFTGAALADADVRDKSFLDAKRREEGRRRGWGRALWAVAALLLLAAGVEIGAGVLALWNRQQREVVAGQAAEVQRIETAQTLATRIEDLAARQEKPLEWLSVVSAVRPRSVQFTRVVSNNDRSLTIDAQTADAAAVGTYEAALRERPELEQVEMRDLRSREGLTSFLLYVKFQPAGSDTKGGQP